MSKAKYVMAFLSGFMVFLILGAVAAFGITIASDALGSGSYRIGNGIFTIYEFERSGKSFAFAVRGGIVIVGIIGGILNNVLLGLLNAWKRKN